MHLFHFSPTLTMVAMRTGCYNIRPDMLTAHMTRSYMIHGQVALALSTVLTGIIVAAKNLAARQFDVGAGPVHLVLQPNDGRTWQQLFYRSNMSPPINNHACLACQEQADRPPRGTNINRLKISI